MAWRAGLGLDRVETRSLALQSGELSRAEMKIAMQQGVRMRAYSEIIRVTACYDDMSMDIVAIGGDGVMM